VGWVGHQEGSKSAPRDNCKFTWQSMEDDHDNVDEVFNVEMHSNQQTAECKNENEGNAKILHGNPIGDRLK
jgi:hypothetical protein